MMQISANFEGMYPDLIHFINLLDKSDRLLIIESLNATPQQSGGRLNVMLKLDTFVRRTVRRNELDPVQRRSRPEEDRDAGGLVLVAAAISTFPTAIRAEGRLRARREPRAGGCRHHGDRATRGAGPRSARYSKPRAARGNSGRPSSPRMSIPRASIRHCGWTCSRSSKR